MGYKNKTNLEYQREYYYKNREQRLLKMHLTRTARSRGGTRRGHISFQKLAPRACPARCSKPGAHACAGPLPFNRDSGGGPCGVSPRQAGGGAGLYRRRHGRRLWPQDCGGGLAFARRDAGHSGGH